MRALLASLFVLCAVSSASARSFNHCEKFAGKELMEPLIRSLAAKLQYDYKEFCSNPRIADIYNERRMVYHREDDKFHPYEFVTIHYYEYSCEYQYNIETQSWGKQYCYNTF